MASPLVALTPVSPTSLVHSVNGLIGTVVLTPAIIGAAPAMGADDNYVTDAEKVVIGNTSGTNTGDQTATTVPNTPAGNIAATNVQAAINELDSEKIAVSTKGVANGVASLDASGLVPVTQLPPAALERLVVVANQDARYALTTATVQNGDTVKQTDTGEMWYVVDDTQLNGAAGYSIYTAGTASAVALGGITGLAAGIAAFLATPSGANLLAALTTKTGTGLPVFADSPALTNPTVTTQTDSDSSTKAASTSFVKSQISNNVNSAMAAQGLNLTAATGLTSGQAGVWCASNAQHMFGSGDFTIIWYGSVPDWTPAATTVLLGKTNGSTVGYSLNLFATTGAFRVRLGSSVYDPTASASLVDGTPHIVMVSVDQTALTLTWYVDGIQLGDPVPFTGPFDTSASNTLNLQIGGQATTRYGITSLASYLMNRKITATEALLIARTKRIPYEDTRGSTTGQTSGTLLSGYRYRITTFVAGDSFTNVGASSNATGVEFVATGTTPTTWTNGSTLNQIGATLMLEPEGIQTTQWHDSSINELHGSFPSSGVTPIRWMVHSQHNWVGAITADTTLTDIVPAGYELEKIVFRNTTANAVSVRLGTTAAGTDVFGLTALNTSATLGGFKTILCNQGFNLTAAQTLYLSSTSWNSASLTATFYFRRIS